MAQSPKTEMLDASTLLPGKVILSITTPEGRKIKHSIRQAETTVGRSPNCDLTLDDPMVSGRHCSITAEEGGWRLRDLGSSNGTMLNGEFVEDEWLQDGDKLTLGKTIVAVRIEEGAAAQEEEESPPPPRKAARSHAGARRSEAAPASNAGLIIAIVVAAVVLVVGGTAAFLLLKGGEKKKWQTYQMLARDVLARAPCALLESQVQAINGLGPIPTTSAKYRKSYFGKDKLILTPADKVANARLAGVDADRVRLYNETLNLLTAQRTQIDQKLAEMKALAADFQKEEYRRKVDAVEAAMLLYIGQADTVLRTWRVAAGEAQAYATMFDEMFVRGNPLPLSGFERFRMTKSADAILKECQIGMQKISETVMAALGDAK